MSGRFRLDPRDAPAEPYAPPAPAPAPAAAPPPPPPRPAPKPAAAAEPRKGRRRAIVLALAIVAVLVLGGVIALVATAESYPDSYVLARSEYPSGMSLARLSENEMGQLGIEQNPGEVDKADLDDYESDSGQSPSRGYAQVLAASTGRVSIMALQYAKDEDATSVAKEMRAICSFASGAVLRDGKVLVAIVPEGGASRNAVRAVANALLDKNGDLEPVCGAS